MMKVATSHTATPTPRLITMPAMLIAVRILAAGGRIDNVLSMRG
jgi:hypothetical protein